MNQISKILIANRGEIALRIIKTARKMNILTAVVFAGDDEQRQYVKEADEAWLLEGDSLTDTYLNAEKIIEIALQSRASAIHPGYGFLSENTDFAQQCSDNNIIWIGPSPKAMKLMSDKLKAQELAHSLGIPVIASVSGSTEQLIEAAKNLDFPIIIKAAAGGGGRGMKIARNLDELPGLLEIASREALQFFGNNSLFLAQYLENAKHIEVQILADQHGNAVHLFERECSIQRRHQKIIEEAPAVSISDKLKQKMYTEALLLTKTANYSNAGTIEFLADENGKHYFLEMNTRIQVEHPVTEMVTGIDLIEQQIRIAEGCKLSLVQEKIKLTGHAIECRICAEDTENGFAPSTGKISLLKLPLGKNVRIDSDILEGIEINTNYDSMLAKLIVFAETRNETMLKTITSLKNFHVHGIETNISLLSEIIQNNQFAENTVTTRFLEINGSSLVGGVLAAKNQINQFHPLFSALVYWLFNNIAKTDTDVWHNIGFWRQLPVIQCKIDEKLYYTEILEKTDQNLILHINGEKTQVTIITNNNNKVVLNFNKHEYSACVSFHPEGGIVVSTEGIIYLVEFENQCYNRKKRALLNNLVLNAGNASTQIVAPIPGKVSKIKVMEGQVVDKGAVLAIIESMKTENQLLASANARVSQVHVHEGEQIKANQLIFALTPLSE